MELTKEQRHEIYIKALEFCENNTNDGLCDSLYKAIYIIVFNKSATKKNGEYRKILNKPEKENICPIWNLNKFPEIAKHKPPYSRVYWFPISDREPRIKILKQAIKETE
jgi:hypothetical protein